MTVIDVGLLDEVSFHDWFAVVEEVFVEAWPGDPMWASEQEMRDLFSDREYFDRVLLVHRGADGVVAGAAEIGLPKKDNLHLANIDVSVRATSRGAGIGRSLVEAAEAVAAERGRSVWITNTFGHDATADSEPARFARSAGYELARVEVRRELRLPLADGRLEELWSEHLEQARDYEFVSWSGRCPEDLVASRAKLATALTTDEPHGDLQVEGHRYDVDRIRKWEEMIAKTGRELVCTGAVSRATGELFGVTEVGLPREGDELAAQFATVVAREHRGHRLGILLKVANLTAITAREHQPRRIHTWNAESNGHMIGVNEELGFEIAGRAFNWQKTSTPPSGP